LLHYRKKTFFRFKRKNLLLCIAFVGFTHHFALFCFASLFRFILQPVLLMRFGQEVLFRFPAKQISQISLVSLRNRKRALVLCRIIADIRVNGCRLGKQPRCRSFLKLTHTSLYYKVKREHQTSSSGLFKPYGAGKFHFLHGDRQPTT
jgi:hypothetical protein